MHTFTTTLTTEKNSGWVAAVWEGSKEILGTGKAIRKKVSVDGVEYETSLLPFGDGNHFVPVKKEVRLKIKKGEGDEVVVTVFGE